MSGENESQRLDDPYGSVTLAFGPAEYGWVQMCVMATARLQSVVCLLSYIENPIGDCFEWLNNIADSALPAKWIINEEGREKALVVTAVEDDPSLILLVITNGEQEQFLRTLTHRGDFLKRNVESFRSWLVSVYDPLDWYADRSEEDLIENDRFDHRTLDFESLKRIIGQT